VSWPDGEIIAPVVDDPAQTVLQVAWSPEGRRLAFNARAGRQINVYVADLPSGEIRQVTDFPGLATSPVWSPDGQRVAFAATGADPRNARLDIYTWAPDAADVAPVNLTAHPHDDEMPAWLADGQHLVFVSFRDGAPRLYRIPAAGGEAVPLSTGPGQDRWPVTRVKPLSLHERRAYASPDSRAAAMTRS
jgi:TolB protein